MNALRLLRAPALVLATTAAVPCAAQVVNAPVAPDTIYVARVGANAGLSVIDLNGFGQSTGNPTYDMQNPVEGNSNFPNNPNVRLQGALMRPPLAPGTTTVDGGSAGVFTLTKNSLLGDVHLRAPSVLAIGDMMLGHPLDTTFNAGPAPFGCQAGGGNLCATDSKKLIDVALGGNTLLPADSSHPSVHQVQAGGNPISWAPHPNPPPLLQVPLCQFPFIGGQEPTSIDTTEIGQLTNLLGPGDPFGDPAQGIPPSGLLTAEQNLFFVGPSLPQPTLPACLNFQYRQQIGHFMYVVDRERDEIAVVHSNRLRVLKRIALPDPTELAMSPNLSLLAVTSRATNSVHFIDTDPTSGTFHQVVAVTQVGIAPRGIAWDPGDEDILVCNEGDDSVSILSAFSLTVRKVVRRLLDRPFAVAITQRQANFGFFRNVYFAYILDRAGHLTLFESGPSGVNGWGFDEIIGRLPFEFWSPRAIQPDPLDLRSAVWIAHERQLGQNGQPTGLPGGAVTKIVFNSGIAGQIPLTVGDTPHMRDMSFAVARSIGSDQLSGVPLDLAFDDLRNLGALPNYTTGFSAHPPAALNGKSQVREVGGQVYNTNEASYLFVPVRGAGVVDVIKLSTGLRVDTNAYQVGVQSIPASGAVMVMDYFRQ